MKIKNEIPVENNKLPEQVSPAVFEPDAQPRNFARKNYDRKVNYSKLTYIVYPLEKLTELFEALKKTSGRQHTLRYLVDEEFRLWLAFEGPPSRNIPAHGQMIANDRCIAAGNIKMSKESPSLQIRLINNKSGDFRPSVMSMQWILAILLANEARLPSNFLPTTIELESVDPNDLWKGSKFFNKEDLREKVTPLIQRFPDISRQPTETKSADDINSVSSQVNTSINAENSPYFTPNFFSRGKNIKRPFSSQELESSPSKLVCSLNRTVNRCEPIKFSFSPEKDCDNIPVDGNSKLELFSSPKSNSRSSTLFASKTRKSLFGSEKASIIASHLKNLDHVTILPEQEKEREVTENTSLRASSSSTNCP